MRIASKLLFLCAMLLFLSACLQNTKSNKLTDLSPPVEISIDEAQTKIPFMIKQPSVPFRITKKSAKILDTNGKYDAVEITYENTNEGLTLTIMIINSKVGTSPNSKKGLKLANGSQTWDQEFEHVNAIYWRHEGLNYTLASVRNNNGESEKLYDHQTLSDIANTIK